MSLSEYIDLMLDGAAQTGEFRGDYANDDLTETCAMGAARYAWFMREGLGLNPNLQCVHGKFRVHENAAWSDYVEAYGTRPNDDNDKFGRDYVIARFKELL